MGIRDDTRAEVDGSNGPRHRDIIPEDEDAAAVVEVPFDWLSPPSLPPVVGDGFDSVFKKVQTQLHKYIRMSRRIIPQ